MNDSSQKNTSSLLSALKNVLSRFYHQHPTFTFSIVVILGLLLYTFINNGERLAFFLCLLISIMSIIIYSKRGNYGETVLSFMLGILTVFSIDWDKNKTGAIIFTAFYVCVNVILLFITSIKLYVEKEKHLTSASIFIDNNNQKMVYAQLDNICQKVTKHNALGTIEKSEAIRYLSYMKLSVVEIKEALNVIELIKVVFEMNIKESCSFFYSLLLIQYPSKNMNGIERKLDFILNKRLPLSPNELSRILIATKSSVISGTITFSDYLDYIEECVIKGYTLEEIEKDLGSKG